MKMQRRLLGLMLAVVCPLLTQCASAGKGKKAGVELSRAGENAAVKEEKVVVKAEKKAEVKAEAPVVDDLDEYSVVDVADPLERMNRVSFWCNDKMYLIVFRPISKGYEKVIPKRLRNGIFNAFENAKYPVRLGNSLLQGKFKRMGLHTEKFLLNTVGGIGGLIRVSDKFPKLAELPDEDTGKTFAKWGMGHGFYLVIPFMGPSSLRDGVGLIGDYAMNPVNWGVFWSGSHDWTAMPPAVNTLRALPGQLALYDETKRDAIDPYLAVRSGYVQFRAASVKK